MNMIKTGQKIALCLAIVLGVGVVAPINQPNIAYADVISDACNLAPDSEACKGMQGEGGFTKIVGNIINTALMIVGILAVAMIIFSGIRYVTSSGNKQRVEQAKQILIYSITGLVVAICAYAIVNFVIDRLM